MSAEPFIPFIQAAGLWTHGCYKIFDNDNRMSTMALAPEVYRTIKAKGP